MKVKILHKQEKSEYQLLMENNNFRNSRHYIYTKKSLGKIYDYYAFQIIIGGNPIYMFLFLLTISFLFMFLFFGIYFSIIGFIFLILIFSGKEKFYKFITRNLFYKGKYNYYLLTNFASNQIVGNNKYIKSLFIKK